MFLVGYSVAALVVAIPDLLTGMRFAFDQDSNQGIESLVNSNILNIGIAFGLTLLLSQTTKMAGEVERVSFSLLAMTVLTVTMFIDSYLSRVDGFVLLTGYVIISIWILRFERSEGPIYSGYDAEFGTSVGMSASVKNLAIGLIALMTSIYIFGWLLPDHWSGSLFGEMRNTSAGAIILALFNSLPEIMICVIAALAGQYSFALGVVMGSNVTNLSLGIGSAGIVSPSALGPTVLSLHLFVMVAFTLVLFAMIFEYSRSATKSRRESRLEGLMLIVAYLAYAAYVVGRDRIESVS